MAGASWRLHAESCGFRDVVDELAAVGAAVRGGGAGRQHADAAGAGGLRVA
ncbi:MAG: hypothetical protein ACR2MA_09300 [Egibacteraceae bacterium]